MRLIDEMHAEHVRMVARAATYASTGERQLARYCNAAAQKLHEAILARSTVMSAEDHVRNGGRI